MERIDVVVAVRDEEAAIPVFLERLRALALPDDLLWRVLFVEDSSRDGTRALLRRLAAGDERVGYCCLERGFGQPLALSFGLSRSDADAAVLMDVDGGHPPEAIPELVSGYRAGARVVQCVRRRPGQRQAWRRIGAAGFHAFVRVVAGVDLRQQNVYYRLMAAEVVQRFLREPRYWHYVRFPLAELSGGALRFVPIDGPERTLGESKYGPLRLLGLAVDGLLTAMSTRRLLVNAIGAMALAALLAWGGAGAAALALLALLAAVAWRFAALRRPGALARLRVIEQANFPDPDPPH